MNRRIRPLGVLIFAATVLSILLLLFRAAYQANITIRFHDDQVEVQKLSNAIAQLIIEEGYSVKTELVESTIKEMHGKMLRGDIDVALEVWKYNNLLWYRQGMASADLADLGVLYVSGRQYWIVSEWYAKEKGIQNVFDMAAHWQDFTDPGDSSKGIFFNCIIGWTCRDINRAKLKAYALDRYYNTVSPLSPESLESIYRNSHKKHIPVFGYYWEPNLIMEGDGWRVLEEPPFSEEVWVELVKAAADEELTIETACAYPESGVHKIAASRLKSKAPEIFDMLMAMQVEVTEYSTLLRESPMQEERDYYRLATRYLVRNRGQWEGWLTDEARENLTRYLERSGSLGDEDR